MTSTFSAMRRRAVVLLAGTAIALLASAAPALAESGSDNATPAPATTSGAAENLHKKKRPPAPEPSEIIVVKTVDSASP